MTRAIILGKWQYALYGEYSATRQIQIEHNWASRPAVWT